MAWWVWRTITKRWLPSSAAANSRAALRTISGFVPVGLGLEPFRQAARLLSTMPGLSSVSAHVVVAEIGIDMSRFATPSHLLSPPGARGQDPTQSKYWHLRVDRQKADNEGTRVAPVHRRWTHCSPAAEIAYDRLCQSAKRAAHQVGLARAAGFLQQCAHMRTCRAVADAQRRGNRRQIMTLGQQVEHPRFGTCQAMVLGKCGGPSRLRLTATHVKQQQHLRGGQTDMKRGLSSMRLMWAVARWSLSSAT